jgi:hypothetical protein
LPGVYIPPHHPDQSQSKQTQMGIWWPAADSAKLRTAAQAWREMAQALDVVQVATQPAVLNLLADNRGPAMDAFAAYWQKWSGVDGFLPTCSQACYAMAKALDEYAQAVDTARVKVEELVAEISTAVVLGVVLGVCTVGIATAAAGAVSAGLVASAELVGIGLTETAGLILSGVLVGATFGAVEAMAIDIAAIQPEKILLFHDQKDFNWNEVWQWGEMGAAGGFVGGALGAGIGAGADALPATVSQVLATRLGRVAVGGVSGAGTSAILDEVQYGQVSPLDVAAGAVGGMAGGGIRGRLGTTTLQPFDDLASIRVRDGIPAVGDPGGDAFTRSRLDVGGQPFYGKNAPDTVADPPPSATYQSMRHAEGDAVAQAVAAGKTGGEADLYVDRQPCGFCRSSLGGLAKWAQFDVMRVWTPDGLYGTYTVETGKFNLANQP